MSGARVISVNRGQEADLLINGRPARSAIDKRPSSGPVDVGPLGLDGDTTADKVDHGGLDQAVYAYGRDDLDWWTEQLARELPNGVFGENLTTAGIDVSTALIGETWRVGGVVLQVTSPRIPCNTFKSWMDEPHWVRRFAAAGRPGAYLRVLTPGAVAAGDELEVLSRPAVAVTVAESMQAYYGNGELMRRLLQVDGRGAKWDEIAADAVSRA
ncbi:MAG: MOSC domain-containing protein [Actinobacteria bacterium]|nr:MOSC domain-containing protein [Actinomycetota bacterium]